MKLILTANRLAIVFLLGMTSFAAQALEKQLVAGAGPSTELVKLFFLHFSAQPEHQGYRFEVPARSIKHAGGLRASDTALFGRTGRPLNAEEKARGKQEIILGQIPLSFAVGSGAGVSRVTPAQLQGIFSGEIHNWKALGGNDGEIVRVGREPSEAAYGVLMESYPFLGTSPFSRIFERDHQVANFIRSEEGRFAIGFGARDNFALPYRLQVEGMHSGIKLGLVYDVSNAEHPLVKQATAFVASAKWRQVIDKHHYIPR